MMNSDVNELVGAIHKKTKSLIYSLNTLKNENEKLKTENVQLVQSIEKQKKIIEEFKNNNRSKLVADSIKQEEGNSDVKKQIDEMVREIDKCIELLNN